MPKSQKSALMNHGIKCNSKCKIYNHPKQLNLNFTKLSFLLGKGNRLHLDKNKRLISSNKLVGMASSSSKPRLDSSSSVIKKRTVEISSKQSADAKGKSISKTVVNAKATSSSSKTVTKTVTRTREKKVYSLAGQKFDVPEEREPLRLFYESLSKQIPSSEMAEFWLMEHGMLSPERSKRAFEKKQRKQKQLRTGTPTKSSTRPITKSSARPFFTGSSKQPPQQVSKNGDIKVNKRSKNDSDDDDDFILSPKRRKG